MRECLYSNSIAKHLLSTVCFTSFRMCLNFSNAQTRLGLNLWLWRPFLRCNHVMCTRLSTELWIYIPNVDRIWQKYYTVRVQSVESSVISIMGLFDWSGDLHLGITVVWVSQLWIIETECRRCNTVDLRHSRSIRCMLYWIICCMYWFSGCTHTDVIESRCKNVAFTCQ